MIEKGKKVKVHYTGLLENGTQFDSSIGREPLEFTVGQAQLIRGFEDGVVDMVVGETKTINITPKDGYGDVNPNLILTISKSNVPEDIEVGAQLQAEGQMGQPVVFVVREVNEDTVVMDGNHPLSGKNLIFNVELIEVV